MDISYKGIEHTFDMLSGGEQARVILAYTLALSDMFQTPVLMLDECTSSLDSELTGNVIETIKENFKHKLVLISAHQLNTESHFDNIIKLS